jgi:hypothetical protein
MILKSFVLASTAVFALGAGARAADLPVAEPVEYVRICDAFGTGFFYIPGTDTCLKLAGYVRAEMHYVDGEVDAFYGVSSSLINNWSTRVRGQVSFDARTQTDIGLIRAYVALEGQRGHANVTSPVPLPPTVVDGTYDERFRLGAAYIEVSNDWGTYTAGRRGSFFDFWGPHGYGTRINVDDSTTEVTVFALTFAFGNGLSATLSAEDPDSANTKSRRRDGDDDYEGLEAPDGVVNIRLDQGWGSAQVMGAIRHIHDGPDIVPPGPIPGPIVVNPGEDGIGFAVGAGASIGIPGGWMLEGQGGYSQGAIAYITDDPGQLGDISGLTGEDQTEAWAVRAGIIGPIFGPNLTAWVDGSYTDAEADDGDNYTAWAFKTGARWQPAPGLGMGPEFAYQTLDMNDVGNPGAVEELPDYEVWGLMWRVQRNF